MAKSKQNPWHVENINMFHLWCCPECKYRCPEQNEFEEHAIINHPNSSVLIKHPVIKEEIIDDPVDNPDDPVDNPIITVDNPLITVDNPVVKQEIFVGIDLPDGTLDTNVLLHESNYMESNLMEIDENPVITKLEIEVNSVVQLDHDYNVKAGELSNNEDNDQSFQSDVDCCPFCSQVFPSTFEKKEHMLSTHVDENGVLLPVKCGNCLEIFVKPFKAKPKSMCSKCAHGTFECAYCDETFLSKQQRLHHEEKNHGTYRKVNCQYCQQEISSSVRLRLHVIQGHIVEIPKIPKIPKIPQKTKNGKSPKIPKIDPKLKGKYPNIKPSCVICKKLCDGRGDLALHFEEHKRDNKCGFCSARFQHDLERDQHEKLDHKDDPLKLSCEICCINLAPKQLREHIKSLHRPKKSETEMIDLEYKCKVCFESFPSKVECWSHEMSHLANTVCSYCFANFDSDISRNSHERSNHVDPMGVLKTVKCWFCDIIAKSSIHLRKHVQEIHPEKEEQVRLKLIHRCEHCDEYFNTPISLSEHVKKHDLERCAYCEKLVLVGKPLEIHEKENHTDKSGVLLDLKCRRCRRHLKSTVALREHFHEYHMRSTDMENNDWKCCVCDKSFKSKLLLKKHKRQHQAKPVEKVVCQHCGFESYGEDKLRKHVRNVHSEKKHECAECGAKFSGRHALIYTHKCAMNQKTRQQSEPHPCPSCDEILYSKLKMVKHHYVVHGAMPVGFEGKEVFHCKKCPQVFFAKENLARHYQEHEDVEPKEAIKCPLCDAKVKNKRGLYSHYSVVHKLVHEDCKDLEQFHCEYCGVIFHTKSCFLAHVKSHTDPRTLDPKVKKSSAKK